MATHIARHAPAGKRIRVFTIMDVPETQPTDRRFFVRRAWGPTEETVEDLVKKYGARETVAISIRGERWYKNMRGVLEPEVRSELAQWRKACDLEGLSVEFKAEDQT